MESQSKNTFKKVLVVGCTDYGRLTVLPFNRGASIRPDLRDSILANGFTDEIKVVRTSCIEGGSKKLYIVDGQNRWLTASSMNHPIDYIIEKDTEDRDEIARMVVTYNSKQKPWELGDYVTLYAYFQNRNYVILNDIRLKYDISIATAAALLNKNIVDKKKDNRIRNGDFIITNEILTLEVLEEVRELRREFTIKNTLVRAIYGEYTSGDYSRDRLAEQLRKSMDNRATASKRTKIGRVLSMAVVSPAITK